MVSASYSADYGVWLAAIASSDALVPLHDGPLRFVDAFFQIVVTRSSKAHNRIDATTNEVRNCDAIWLDVDFQVGQIHGLVQRVALKCTGERHTSSAVGSRCQ